MMKQRTPATTRARGSANRAERVRPLVRIALFASALALLLVACADLVGPPDDGDRPRVTGSSPSSGQAGVLRDGEVRLTVDSDSPLDPATVGPGSVFLTRTGDDAPVPANVALDGAFDVVVTPVCPLSPTTEYRIEATEALADQAGGALVPFSSTFTTGTGFAASGDRSYITTSDPSDGDTDVFRDVAITTMLNQESTGVYDPCANDDTVVLRRASDMQPVAGTITVSGGRDSIIFRPDASLAANTEYVFEVGDGVTDGTGTPFEPYSISFTTGEAFEAVYEDVEFTRSAVYSGTSVASLAITSDGAWIYATNLQGELRRWPILADGGLGEVEAFGGSFFDGRALIGIAFDPDDPDVLWVTHNDPVVLDGAEDFTGRIARVTLNDGSLEGASAEDVVVGLPRSTKDHMTNSLAFDEQGDLYVLQGSNTGAGAPDNAWGMRQERLLSAALLRIELDQLSAEPLDVETVSGEPGSYSPYAAGAPLTLYATGIRNAYDLVFHSNGHLYVPANGGNGGNAPASPDGSVPALNGVYHLPDYLFLVEEGGYYGHPNVTRDEYVLNGGNPTAGIDPAEVVPVTMGGTDFDGYEVGIDPDPNYRGFVEEFCCNDSINGALEYMSGSFGGALTGKLLFVRYTKGDIIAIEFDGDGTMAGRTTVMTDFERPLDMAENPTNGDIYVAELPGWSQGTIQLLRVDGE